jgi:putative transposase
MRNKLLPTVLPIEVESSLKDLLNKGTAKARTLTRARILLALHQGKTPEIVSKDVFVSLCTVYNVRDKYHNEDLERALYDAPRSGAPIQISGKARAEITALACTEAPTGHLKWTLQMLADKSVELKFVDDISYGSVHNILKKTNCNPTAKKIGV